MKRRGALVILILTLVLAWTPVRGEAQAGPDGWTLYEMNLRAGPGTTYAALATLPPDTGLIFEAHDGELVWLLGRTEDGSARGWVHSLYLRYADGFAAARLPASGEIIGAPAPESAPPDDAIPSGEGPDAWTVYSLNMRGGPLTSQPVLSILPPNTGLALEGRTADTAWVLGTADGGARGWVSTLYVRFQPGFSAPGLPVSDEIIGAPAASDSPAIAGGNPEWIALLESIPVVPAISGNARAIYAGSGNNPHVFAKIGDCNSEDWSFMSPFDTGQYDLGPYAALQPTIGFFSGSFARGSVAAHVGFNALTVIDATWADPGACEAGESPVWCELRRSRAAVAVIMFGSNDVYNLSADGYEQALRQIVEWSVRHGTVPVLSTFTWPPGAPYQDKALLLNVITVNVARAYDVPLINFWRAARELPNMGMIDDIHLSVSGPPYGAYFTGQETSAGFTMRNLVTLQTLDALRQQALY